MTQKDQSNNNNSNSEPQVLKQADALHETITKCLQMLKITYIEKEIFNFFVREKTTDIDTTITTATTITTLKQINTYGIWLVALNAIADFCIENKYILSQSQIYDFLTIAVTTSVKEEERIRIRIIDNIIFELLYKDIMVNYQSSEDWLKIAFPKIIVDMVSVLAKEIDMEGNKISRYNIESYYQTRKGKYINSRSSKTKTAAAAAVKIPTATTATATAATIADLSIYKNKEIEQEIEKETEQHQSNNTLSLPLLSSKSKSKLQKTSSSSSVSSVLISPYITSNEKREIIENLHKITNRSKESLELSFGKLHRSDIIRLKHLCINSTKLQRYYKLINKRSSIEEKAGGGDQEEGKEEREKEKYKEYHQRQKQFKSELEKDTGRKLSDYQVYHAANSIKKYKLYIENVLDAKFLPYGSFGINHIKHNLEYGYQLAGIIQSKKRRNPSFSSSIGDPC